MSNGWHDISEIEEFREKHEHSHYLIIAVNDRSGLYRDIAPGIKFFPKNVTRFCLIPRDKDEIEYLI